MDQTTLNAQVRETTGKGVAHRLRAQKLIPAVVYGPHSEKPLNIAVDPKALKAAVNTPHKLNTILTLKLDKGGERLALLKDYQQEPVSREVLHADFYEVKMGEPVTVPVPLVLEGRAEGVAAGGILTQLRREVDVVCTPDAIPERVSVDVSALKAGVALHIADVAAPKGTKIRYLTNFTVATISAPEEEAATPAQAAETAAAGKAPAKGKK